VIGSAATQLIKELRELPFTLVAVLSLIMFAFYADTTYAVATDVRQLSEQVEKVLTLQIAESLRNLQRQYCSTDDPESRRTLSRTIDTLQNDYRHLTGARYPLTGCE
jgi:hypothetical protein